MKEEISFIVRHYRKDSFNASRGWRKLGLGRSLRTVYYRVAAAAAGVIVLSATAMMIYHHEQSFDKPSVPMEQTSTLSQVKVIDFENTPLPLVVAGIEEAYGVEVGNLPDNSDELRLSLHYEGNAVDLVETINSILGTQLTVEQL